MNLDFQAALHRGEVDVQSFNHAWFRSYKDRAPDVPVGLLFGARPTEVQIADAASWGVDGIITNYPQVLREILRRG